MTEFNINDHVYVKVNKRGLEILAERDTHLNNIIPIIKFDIVTGIRVEQEANGGWSRWQLWDLIHTFGANMHMGCVPPIETTIRLSEPHRYSEPVAAAALSVSPQEPQQARMLNDYADLLELLGRELHAGAEQKYHRGFSIAQIRAAAAVPVSPQEERPPCSGCGGPHPFDTVLPSEVWNETIRAAGLPDFLCWTCIVAVFARKGVSFNCELWGETFDGLPVAVHFNSRRARHSQMLVQSNTELRHRLSEAERACKQFKEAARAAAVPPPPREEPASLRLAIIHLLSAIENTDRDRVYGVLRDAAVGVVNACPTIAGCVFTSAAALPETPKEAASAHEHEFAEFTVCRFCGQTEAAILGCHHCDEPQASGRCWWCLKPQAALLVERGRDEEPDTMSLFQAPKTCKASPDGRHAQAAWPKRTGWCEWCSEEFTAFVCGDGHRIERASGRCVDCGVHVVQLAAALRSPSADRNTFPDHIDRHGVGHWSANSPGKETR